MVAILSNGGFDGIYEKLPARLREQFPDGSQTEARMISSLIFIANMVVLGIPIGAALHSLVLDHRQRAAALQGHALHALVSSCRLAGVRIRVEGLERVPRDRACIFMSNHVSNLDPPALISLIPGRTSAFMKRSLMKLPILGTGFRQGEFIAVDRSGSRADAQESVAAAQRVLAKGVHITTFVEGTRSPDGRMLPFKKGPFFLAMEAGAPCIPVSIYGTETMLAQGQPAHHPGTRTSSFIAPIDPADFATREELMQAVRAAIASGLPEWMRT